MEKAKFKVETIENEKFKFLGFVEVDMEVVYKAMAETKDIKDNMPSKFARKLAEQRWPDANPIVLTQVYT